MAIDFNARPAGMSKREYAASVLGGSKENYSDSGQPKSAGSSSSKTKTSSVSTPKVKEVKFTDLVDTKPIEQAYGAAKETYLGTLTALKPRYEALYNQLEAEKTLAQEKETALAGEEKTQQKVNLAKRGISTDTDNPFYTTEAGKLTKEQTTRSKETALQFAGKRLDISGAESADTRDITTAIANLDLGKANTIGSMTSTAKQSAASLNSAAKERAIQQDQWERNFAYTQSKDAADRALDAYRLSKASSDTKSSSVAVAAIQDALLKSRGEDMKVDPNVYAEQRKNYLTAVKGSTISDFDSQFAGLLSPEEQKNFGINTLMTQAQQIKQADIEAKKAEELFQKQIKAREITSLVDQIKQDSSLGSVLGAWDNLTPTLLPGSVNVKSKIDQLKSITQLANMGVMKGVLSDKDMEVIEKASNRLKYGMSTTDFKTALDEISNKINEALGRNPNDPLGLGF